MFFSCLIVFIDYSRKFSKTVLELQASTLVLAEHDGGSINAASVSAIAAAGSLSKDSSISVLLAGSGPSLQEAAEHAASCHPSISQVSYDFLHGKFDCRIFCFRCSFVFQCITS